MNQGKSISVVKCANCKAMCIPPQYVCRECGNTQLEEKRISGKGTVYTHTTIRVAPEAHSDQVPYQIAIVELAPKLRLTTRIIKDKEKEVEIGQQLFFDHEDENGYWFRTEA